MLAADYTAQLTKTIDMTAAPGAGVPHGSITFTVGTVANLPSWAAGTAVKGTAAQIKSTELTAAFTGGTAKSWKFDLQQPKNRLMANVWNADDTWTIEVYENGVKTGDMAKKSMIDPWSSAYFCGFCGLKESYASKNDHIFYYTVKSPGAALRVVARDGYGNVFEQTEITTPLEADYPDAY